MRETVLGLTVVNRQGETLGTVAGVLRVTAQVGGLTPVTFSATAVAGAAATVIAGPAHRHDAW